MSELTAAPWPELTAPGWIETRETVQLWTQIVGKVRLALEPMLNHWWQVPLYVSARGLTTSLMHLAELGLEIEFDFLDHLLALRTSNGRSGQVALQPGSIASFYEETMAALEALGLSVRIWPRPVEMRESIPFPEDQRRRDYDRASVEHFFQALIRMHRVMTEFRARFIGKASPVHFFWGGPDLAVTRFSGRPAPLHPGGVPNCPDWVQQLAYSHEVSSCGYWPGGDAEGAFYAYAYPQPEGFADWPLEPAAAYYDATLGEFQLPYAAVRSAPDPEACLLAFFQSSYEAAAELAHWDRAALEVGAPS